MRYIQKYIVQDLQKKMVFVGGPRQSGKTTLAKDILEQLEASSQSGQYFNWDYPSDRKLLLSEDWIPSASIVVLDEIHKYTHWKNWVKGLFDVLGKKHQILVTGSARLDLYRRGGDSLLGRYHYWRLHPFTIDELPPKMTKAEAFKRIMEVGGFPEPFLDGTQRHSKRWRKERTARVIKDDIRDLESIKSVTSLELFLDRLKTRVGGSVAIANLASDVQISPHTAKRWLEILDNMYVTLTVYPFSTNIARALQKPPKVYFYDNADVEGDEAARFENFVAIHLLKRIHFLEDYFGQTCELRYLRDKENREVDFVIIVDKQVETLVEVKLSDSKISTSLLYYAEKLKPKNVVQIVANLKKPYGIGNVKVISALDYFQPIWNL